MKNNLFIKTVCLLLLFSFIFSLSASAIDYKGIPSTDGAASVYFANLTQNKTVIKKEGGTSIAPASATKIVAGLLAIKTLSSRIDETVTVTQAMINGSLGTSMGLSDGDTVTVLDLMYGALCGGFNDAAYALAYLSSGSHTDFVKEMNSFAQSIGASNTNFVNPTGYDDEKASTTLDDVITIAKAAIKDELYMKITSTVSKEVNISGKAKSFTLYNRNGLISSHYSNGYVNKSAEGLIAGFTDLGGYTVITKALINGDCYLCVIMGGKELGESITSYKLANALISYAQKNLATATVMEKGKFICTIPVDLAVGTSGKLPTLDVCTAKDATAFLPKDTVSRITHKYYLYSDSLEAPVAKNTVVGRVDLYCDKEFITSVPLIVTESIEANGFLVLMKNMRSAIFGRTTLLIIIFLAILFPLRSVWLSKSKNRRKRTDLNLRNGENKL